jgi:uncharacterized membrane protein YhaH (DUF805 family)
MNWYLNVLRHYADFSGRARRKEYWMFVLFNLVFLLAAGDIIGKVIYKVIYEVIGVDATAGVAPSENASSGIVNFCRMLYILATFLPSLAVLVRRLHDTGHNGWWTLLTIVPALFTLPLAIARIDLGITSIHIALIVGNIWLFVLTLLKGQEGDNRYGHDPRSV